MSARKRPAFTKWPKKMGLAKRRCARESFRTVKKGSKTVLVFCCPVGKWMPRKKKCRASMKMHVRYSK